MKTTSTLLTVLLSITCFAQDAEFNWATHYGGTSDEEIEAMAVDNDGNVYSVGLFSGTVDMIAGPGQLGWTSNGGTDIFISKTDSMGQLSWAKRIGNGNHDNAYDITLDSENNVLISGSYYGTMDFDPADLTDENRTSLSESAFVLKLDANGNYVFVKDFHSDFGSAAFGRGISTDGSDNIYVVGTFEDSVDFDPGNDEFKLTGDDGNVFLAKLSSNGDFLWAKQIIEGTGYSIEGDNMSVKNDQSDNIYVSGTFTGEGDFNPGPDSYSMQSAGPSGFRDVFIVKLNPSGNFDWAGQITGEYLEYVNDMVIDHMGSCYVTGSFGYEADFDPDGSDSYLLNGSNNNAYLCKWDTDGNFVWAHNVADNPFGNSTYGNGVSVDKLGNVYNTGSFPNETDFDPHPVNELILDAYFTDSYVTKYNSSGDLIWAKIITSLVGCYGYEIDCDTIGNVYIGGNFEGTTDFNPDETTVSNLVSEGNEDVFITKWNYIDIITSLGGDVGEFPLNCYPNPTTSNVYFDFGESTNNVTLNVLNTIGQLTYTVQLNGVESYNLQLPNTKGIYLVQIIRGNGSISTLKIEKE